MNWKLYTASSQSTLFHTENQETIEQIAKIRFSYKKVVVVFSQNNFACCDLLKILIT